MSETPICERCYHPKTRHVAGGCDVPFGFGEYCGCIIDSQPPAPAPNEPREGRYAYAHMCRDEVAGTRGGSDGRREVTVTLESERAKVRLDVINEITEMVEDEWGFRNWLHEKEAVKWLDDTLKRLAELRARAEGQTGGGK